MVSPMPPVSPSIEQQNDDSQTRPSTGVKTIQYSQVVRLRERHGPCPQCGKTESYHQRVEARDRQVPPQVDQPVASTLRKEKEKRRECFPKEENEHEAH